MHSDAFVRKLGTPKTPNRTSPLSSADDWSTPQTLKQTGTEQTDREQAGNKNRETGRSATGLKTRGRSILRLVTKLWMIGHTQGLLETDTPWHMSNLDRNRLRRAIHGNDPGRVGEKRRHTQRGPDNPERQRHFAHSEPTPLCRFR